MPAAYAKETQYKARGNTQGPFNYKVNKSEEENE